MLHFNEALDFYAVVLNANFLKLKWLQRYLLLNHETLKHYKTVGMGIKLPWNWDMLFFFWKIQNAKHTIMLGS